MDTKWKSRHKLGVFLVWVVIFAAAALMVASFPMIVRENEKQKEEIRNDYRLEGVENFCGQMIHWPYVLWMEEKEAETGKVLTPSQVFAPGLLEKVNSYTEVPRDSNVKETQAAFGNSEGETQAAFGNPEGETQAAFGNPEGETQAAFGNPEGETQPVFEDAEVTEPMIGVIELPDTYGEGAEDTMELEIRLEQERQEAREKRELLNRVCRDIDYTARLWQTNFKQWEDQVQYRILDEQGQILRESGEPSVGNWLRVRMHYDEQGILDGVSVQPSNDVWEDVNKEDFVKRVERALTEYYYQTTLRDAFSVDEVSDEIQLVAPSSRTYEFVIGVPAVIKSADWDYYDFRSFMENRVYLLVLIVIAAGVILAALLLPRFKSLELGKGKISAVPFELVVPGLGFLATGGYICGAFLTGALATGMFTEYTTELLGWSSGNVTALGFVIYFLYWTVIFALGYWCVQCLGTLFTMGFVEYLKRRTIVGMCCVGVVRTGRRICRAFSSVDLESRSSKMILKVVLINFLVLALISCFWMFGIPILIVYSIVLFLILDRYWGKIQQKYEILLKAVSQMADGKLDTEISGDLGMFESLKRELQKVQKGFKKAVEEETRSQRMKTELITNVSHDLKTPLTAIVTYVNLLKKEDITDEERKSYIEILDKKSMRLKTLIEDLFEVSKAASRTVQLNLVEVDIVSLLKQVRLELADRLEQSGVQFRWELPEEKVILMLDSDKTYRIFENLLVNIAKYAMAGTRAYIEVKQEVMEEESSETLDTAQQIGSEAGVQTVPQAETAASSDKIDSGTADSDGVDAETAANFRNFINPPRQKKRVWISMKNISSNELHVNPEELTERFVRGDESRNTEGSGLGLAIAKNFVEAQGGKMEISVEADLFKVLIEWNV